MKFKRITLMALLCVLSQPVMASPSINDMQSCQGLLDFIDSKLDPAPSKYMPADVKKVRSAFKKYNEYIQQQIVSPGLLKFNGGDVAKANLMQKQVDAYKVSLSETLQKRYPQHRLFRDQVIAVNNCAKKAVPSGQALEELKKALFIMIELAKK